MTIPVLVFSLFLILNIFSFSILISNKKKARTQYSRLQEIRNALSDTIFHKETDRLNRLIKKYPEESLLLWRDLQSAVTFNKTEEAPIKQIFRSSGIEQKLLKMIGHKNKHKRYRAVQLFRPLVSESTIFHIIKALEKEKQEFIKLVMIKSLIQIGDPDGFDAIAKSLKSCSIQHLKAVKEMFRSTNPNFINWALTRRENKDIETILCILSGAKVHITSWLEDYLDIHLEHDDPRVRSIALETANESYKNLLIHKMDSEDVDILTYRSGILSIPHIVYPIDFNQFRYYLIDPSLQDVAISALKTYISLHPEEIEQLLLKLSEETDEIIIQGISKALVGRLPFLLTIGKKNDALKPVINIAVSSGMDAGLLAFLNQSRDSNIKNWIIEQIKPYVHNNDSFLRNCGLYLKDELLEQFEIQPEKLPASSRKIPLTASDRTVLAGILLLIIALPIGGILYALSGATIGKFSILAREVFRYYTFGFAFYAVTLNIIYILLILFANNNLNMQSLYWKYTDKEYLFTPGVLPSISILAPAYNEEQTVIESVHSLLTLEYPNYQVIVINDGSSDATIEVLIKEFELERADIEPNGSILTAPTKSVYKSHKFAKLIVIDKQNGGKADALNTGINYADKDYICSIDSDSLLEPDSLLRMTTRILTTDTETIAVGGNILPVNGCSVARGMLQTVRLPKNSVARLQTIEYLRSFIAGRLGWSYLNALLIISGAFGLFNRHRVMEIGGYMTGKGEFQRDTVGEDMELVVRLVRYMKQTKNKYLIQYAASANCWTEVPEDISSLYKQRDRWHRGLVEILTFHRKMLFNPKYGSAGLIAFPYFIIFEFIGPFYEFVGYPMMIIGFLTGALHPAIFLTMFSAVILFGVLISIISLALSEKGVVYFHRKELIILLFFTVIESFGFRQLMGWVRVFAFSGMLVKNKGWQKLKRRGFSST